MRQLLNDQGIAPIAKELAQQLDLAIVPADVKAADKENTHAFDEIPDLRSLPSAQRQQFAKDIMYG